MSGDMFDKRGVTVDSLKKGTLDFDRFIDTDSSKERNAIIKALNEIAPTIEKGDLRAFNNRGWNLDTIYFSRVSQELKDVVSLACFDDFIREVRENGDVSTVGSFKEIVERSGTVLSEEQEKQFREALSCAVDHHIAKTVEILKKLHGDASLSVARIGSLLKEGDITLSEGQKERLGEVVDLAAHFGDFMTLTEISELSGEKIQLSEKQKQELSKKIDEYFDTRIERLDRRYAYYVESEVLIAYDAVESCGLELTEAQKNKVKQFVSRGINIYLNIIEELKNENMNDPAYYTCSLVDTTKLVVTAKKYDLLSQEDKDEYEKWLGAALDDCNSRTLHDVKQISDLIGDVQLTGLQAEKSEGSC